MNSEANRSLLHRNISLWLTLCCVMVVIMVAVGGVTRLTGSGLSMTDWRPVTGWLPPMTEQAWNDEFEQYKQSPEFIKINSYFELDDFKGIFWLEYIHRVLGRVSGVIFLLPMIWFVRKSQLSPKQKLMLFIVPVLVGIQGIFGWFMVKSGLHYQPHVSQYWLALHLMMAFCIFAYIYNLTLYYKGHQRFSITVPTITLKFQRGLLLLVIVQIILGAFVAGLDAGKVYNSFPLMDGRMVPTGLFTMEPWYVNFGENITMVQFLHRLGAYCVALVVIGMLFNAYRANVSATYKRSMNWLALIVAGQIILGVATLLYVVPISLASLHQLLALFLFAFLVHLNYMIGAREKKIINDSSNASQQSVVFDGSATKHAEN